MWQLCLKYKLHEVLNVLHHNQKHNTQQLQWINYTMKYLHSTKVASCTSSNPISKPKEQDIDDYKMTETKSKKLPPRLPLVKNFFVGLVDKELLSFPEVIHREEMNDLMNELKPIKDYFNTNGKSTEFIAKKSMADDLSMLGLYGINAPLSFNGKGWNISGSLMAMEPECLATLEVSLGLLNHRSLIDVLMEKGTVVQQQTLLPALTKGSLVATNAFLEKDFIEHGILKTKAVYDSLKHVWYINGEKTFVVMPPKKLEARQLFMVLAQSDRFNDEEKFIPTTTVFLIDSGTPGVNIGNEKIQTLGARDIEICDVYFENVRLKEDVTNGDTCILGNAHEGSLIIDSYLNYQRLRQAFILTCMSKNMLNYLTRYCISTKHCDIPLINLDSIRTHLGKATCAVYGMESMVYLTAGLLDEFQYPDIILEAALTKHYSLKGVLKVMQSSLEIIGEKSLVTGQETEKFVRDAIHLYTQGETLDSLSVFAALTGLKHAGKLLANDVRQQRNPLHNPMHAIKKFLEKPNVDNPPTKMLLHEKVHPSLQPASMCLEQSVVRLQMCVELLLTRYGANILDRHNETARLTEMSSILYAMFASLSRASRSYCIGLPLSDYELLTATTICIEGRTKIKTITEDIYNGEHVNNDNNWQRLSQQIIKSKGYFAAKPLTYNF